MLDSTKNKRPVFVEPEKRSIAPEPWRDGIGFRVFLEKMRQQRRMIVRLMLFGAITGGMAGFAYSVIRTPSFTASSELLISNTTLQSSGLDAVVTQILVENSLIGSAIQMMKSSRVLERVIDRLGVENIELILPKSRIRDLALSLISAPEQERSETSRRQAAVTVLRSNITVDRVGATQIISVRGRARTAEDATRLTNEIARSFVEEQNDTNAVIATSAALRERIKVLGLTVRIISDAVSPGTKDGLAGGVALALAAIAGGALGLSVGLVITLLDRRVRSAAQLAAVAPGECFGYLPRTESRHGSRSGRSGLLGTWMFWQPSFHALALHDPQEKLAPVSQRAVLRRVRSAVLERCGSVPHFVGVTSCRRAEGKTTFAANWAGLIAGDGSRILLVDASPDNPALSNSLTPGETQGLHQLLRGEAVPGDVIWTEIRPNLDFLPCGQAVGNVDMQWFNLVHAIGARGDCSYEWVILDLPALEPVADVRSAGQIVDELLIVVEWGCTSEARLEHALQSLGPVREKFLGAVINKTPWGSPGSESYFEPRAGRSSSAGADIRNPESEGQQP
jgi:Mrp family chromosome partitioning ATPase/capsular polysaccharide biosynthesis protein